MAESGAMWFRVAFIIGSILPAPALAQTWTACVDAMTGGLTAEGYRAVREAAEARRPGQFLNYHLSRSTRVAGQPLPPFRTVNLEMRYAGAGSTIIARDADDKALPAAAQACFEIRAEEGPPPLWHYWGPYFPHGSAVIPDEQRADMEYVLTGYLPGRTIYRLKGYTDTSGSPAFNDRLSAARTEAVARELIRRGVRWSDIEQESFGENRLARGTADGVAEPLNRRVTVDVRLRPEPAH